MGNPGKYKRGVEMSEARERYYKWIDDENWKVREFIKPYVFELEQQNKQLKESQTQKQIIRLCNRLDKAEQLNKQLSIISKNCRGCVKGAFIDCEDCPIYENAVKFVTDKPIDEILK